MLDKFKLFLLLTILVSCNNVLKKHKIEDSSMSHVDSMVKELDDSLLYNVYCYNYNLGAIAKYDTSKKAHLIDGVICYKKYLDSLDGSRYKISAYVYQYYLDEDTQIPIDFRTFFAYDLNFDRELNLAVIYADSTTGKILQFEDAGRFTIFMEGSICIPYDSLKSFDACFYTDHFKSQMELRKDSLNPWFRDQLMKRGILKE